MKTAERIAIIESGRFHLRQWLEQAELHGTIYYTIPHTSRSRLSRRIVLRTIVRDQYSGSNCIRSVRMSRLIPDCDDDLQVAHGDALDVVAKDWGYSFEHNAFALSGSFANAATAIVRILAGLADIAHPIGHYLNLMRLEQLV